MKSLIRPPTQLRTGSSTSAQCPLFSARVRHRPFIRGSFEQPEPTKASDSPSGHGSREAGREGGRGTDREWMTPFHLIPCHPPIRPIVKRTDRMHFRQPQEANVKRRRTAIQENNDQPCMQIPSGEEHRVWDRTFWGLEEEETF